ncbi:WD40 repeat-like protein [Amniculicola lignicola CBS 123094]|uniref:WD40 repeat-like protein n=1 Tax=Amniculicola lignicola CBS 123094 TaxID=1392246 RepID=A0A6A5WPV8_9PLEO|nr:WD40 repeat-like protein [Amniculicola lignicola CBS 123094]
MSPVLHHECTRIPVTALASSGPFLFAAEGHSILFYGTGKYNFLRKERIFEAQAIHGITIHLENNDHGHVTLAIWGGYLVRLLEFVWTDKGGFTFELLQLSAVAKAPDWILDLATSPTGPQGSLQNGLGVCAVVTAHNALLELRITGNDDARRDLLNAKSLPLTVHFSELTSSSRSILYSAHILWESPDRILVAAGTAFGEIIFWSWTRSTLSGSFSHIHQIFLGHEGSIFGVRISKDLGNFPVHGVRRLLASCSDDRTIRIWDITNFLGVENEAAQPNGNDSIRHTGFSNSEFDPDLSTSNCLAIGWGHLSRVWSLQFLDTTGTQAEIFLLSSGEDATSRTWKLAPKDLPPHSDGRLLSYTLLQANNAAYHNGKNIWSAIVLPPLSSTVVLCGAADSQITLYPLSLSSKVSPAFIEYSVDGISAMAQTSGSDKTISLTSPTHKSSKVAEFFRSYSFIDASSILLTTNSGKVYMERLADDIHSENYGAISDSMLVAQCDDLFGYSTCIAEPSLGVGFIAGSKGSIYVYHKSVTGLNQISAMQGKVGSMFVARSSTVVETRSIALLVTLVGQKEAQLLYLDYREAQTLAVSRTVSVTLSTAQTGLVITCMTYIPTALGNDFLLLGYRRGSISMHSLQKVSFEEYYLNSGSDAPFRIIDRAHGKETVTAMKWIPSSNGDSTVGHLISVGRDSYLTIHSVSLRTNTIGLVHTLSLSIGPNLEGLYYFGSHLLVYGFSSTKFVLYDTTTEKEIMSVDTGGSHRSWDFHPHLEEEQEGAGTLVWTRASSMHVQSQRGASHRVVRNGGHGREIKAVTITDTLGGEKRQLIATGAEDTDIKIFEYLSGDLTCRQTLRKHTTGIQHLKWSEDGNYLFSSGGCEEFYIWRIRILPEPLGLGIVCEAVHKPESEHSDLRILSFDVQKEDASFVIAIVFSDSSVKIYSYDPTSTIQWHKLASGTYFTSCLTQAIFLTIESAPTTLLTAGTDGHAVLWSLSSALRPSQSDEMSSGEQLTWITPARIHQNTSKTMDSLQIDLGGIGTTMIVSGGDDGSITFLVTTAQHGGNRITWKYPPYIITRTHASAVTACAFLRLHSRIYLVTSGNDQWVRLWDVVLQERLEAGGKTDQNMLEVRRVKKIKTNVADVSSMAVVAQSEHGANVLICGVGMEVIGILWD